MDLAKYTNLIGSHKKLAELSRDELIQLLELIEAHDKMESVSGLHNWMVPGTPFGIDKLPKHRAALFGTSKYREMLVLGGNRVGKTRLGAYLTAICATGLYPDWWQGIRFDHPVNCWAIGKTSQTTRDTCQKELIGPADALGSGLIPLDCIGKIAKMSKPADAVESVRIKHVPSGKWSTIGFKSYEQSAASFYGTAMHLIWPDEPCPELVYHEAVMRTASTGGKIFHTITPKEGLTRMLAEFLSSCDLLEGTESLPGLEVAKALMAQQQMEMDQDSGLILPKAPKGSRAAVSIGWDSAPWLSEETKQELLAATPPYLRDTVSRGTPSLGLSAVYPVSLDTIMCKPEEMIAIPDHWRRVYGMDVGGKTAAVFLAHDPDSDIVYVTAEYYSEQQPKEVVAARIRQIAGDWMPGVIDPAARQRSQTDGQRLLAEYRRLGLKLHVADNAINAGIHEVWSRLASKRCRFWPLCPKLQEEYTLYRYDDNPSNPKPIKQHDHEMDALRYGIMGLKHAKPKMDVSKIARYGGSNPGRRYNV